MPNLTELGTLEYNGYHFNETTRTKSVQVSPMYDSSGRTCIANVWKCTFQTYIAASDTSPYVQDAVTRLTHPGGALIFQGRGLGNPDINTGQMRDLMWGPKPGPVQLDVIGAGNAVKLTWNVEFTVPCCPGGQYQFALMEFVFTVEHDVDDAGFITRRIRGHLQIPMTRNNVDDRTLSDSADLYRRVVPLPLLLGFKRTWQPWVLSEDRRRLDFGYTDEEQGSEPLPPGIVEATVSETANSSGAALTQWTHTIEGNYRIHRTGNGNVAFNAFMDLIGKRLADLKVSLSVNQGMIPTAFSATNPNRYSKPAARFSLSFTYISSLDRIWKSAKLFDPIPGLNNTWQKWQLSLLNTALNPYGAADLVFITQDQIVDLCQPPGSAGNNQLIGVQERGVVDQALVGRSLQAAFPKPTSDKSWLHYENNLYLESDDGTIPITALPTSSVTSDTDLYGSVPSFAGGVDDAFDSSGTMPSAPGADPSQQYQNILQTYTGGTLRRTTPTCYLTMKGAALRVGYVIDPPRLITVNGVKCVPANRVDRGEGFARGVSANCLYPIYWCSWKLRYYLPSIPQGPLQSAPNPLLGAP